MSQNISKQFLVDSQEAMTKSWISEFYDYMKILERFYSGLPGEAELLALEEKKPITVSRYEELKYDPDALEDYQIGSVSLREGRIINILRRYFLVILFSFVETRISDITELLLENHKQRIELSSIRGVDGVTQHRIFINNRIGNTLNGDQWEAISLLRQLRNYIVHENGITRINPHLPQSLSRYISSCKGLLFDGQELIVSASYCHETLEIVNDFFNRLYPCFRDYYIKIEGKRNPADEMSFDERMSMVFGLPLRTVFLPSVETGEDIEILHNKFNDLMDKVKKEKDDEP